MTSTGSRTTSTGQVETRTSLSVVLPMSIVVKRELPPVPTMIKSIFSFSLCLMISSCALCDELGKMTHSNLTGTSRSRMRASIMRCALWIGSLLMMFKLVGRMLLASISTAESRTTWMIDKSDLNWFARFMAYRTAFFDDSEKSTGTRMCWKTFV